jgi:hypothetical protein
MIKMLQFYIKEILYMSYITDELINVTGTIHNSLTNIKNKQSQINQIKQFVQDGKNNLNTFGDNSLTLEAKLHKIEEIENGVRELELLLKNEIIKVKSICTQYNLDHAFEVASLLSNIEL